MKAQPRQRDENMTPFTFMELPKVNGDFMNGMTRTMQLYMDTMASFQAEFASFVRDRMKQDSELASCLAKCNNWPDMAKTHQDWVRETIKDYLEEANKVAQLTSTYTSDAFGVWQSAGKAGAAGKQGSEKAA